MIKKVILYFTIIVCIILNIIVDTNINNYIKIINECFNKNSVLNDFYYAIICSIIGVISVLIITATKLVVFHKKEEKKGIDIKFEDGTFGTANWLSNEEINSILGKSNTPGIILGKKNEEIIKLPFDSYFNKNIAVFGSSGSMKTIRIFNNKSIRII